MKLLGLLKIDWYEFDDSSANQYWNLRLSNTASEFDSRIKDAVWRQL